MKQELITYYTALEVQEFGTVEAFDKVLETLGSEYLETSAMFYLDEMISSLAKFAFEIGTDIEYYSIGFSQRNRLDFNLEKYKDLTNWEKNEAVNWVNLTMLDKDNAPITGTYTDFYILDYIEKEYPKGVTFNDMTTLLKNIGEYAIDKFTSEEEDNSTNKDVLLEGVNAQEERWDIDGDLI